MYFFTKQLYILHTHNKHWFVYKYSCWKWPGLLFL